MWRKWMVLIGLCAWLTGCGTTQNTIQPDTVQVVATTTMARDLVSVIGGEAVTVQALMEAGVDPHLYQASAGDVTLLEQAEVVVYHGLDLEGKMGDLFDNLQQVGKYTISLEAAVAQEDLIASESGYTYDPHIWFDVSLWQDCAQYVAAQLSAYDEEHQQLYAENLALYLEALNALETYVQTQVSQLDESEKILITAHDAFGYFGKAYGFTVIGLQGISTDSEAGAADVSALANYIVTHQVKAIFIESSVPVKSIQALQAAVNAQGFAVEIGGELYSDSLGDEAYGTDTYLTTVRANVDTIVTGLKG